MNPGKVFEKDFKDSVPHDIFYYRFRDGTANFAGGSNDNVRFQQSNICDCMMFSGWWLFLLELKSTNKSTIPFSMIRDSQMIGLLEASKFDGVMAGYIFNYRHLEKTYFVKAEDIYFFKQATERQSIPLSFVEENGILIEQTLKKVHYKYDVHKFIIGIDHNTKETSPINAI